MASSLSVTYTLSLPAGTPNPPGYQSNQTLQASLPDPSSLEQSAYYGELRQAILRTKAELGEQLTAWRDAVGKREENKEAKVPHKSEEDENEDEGEGEEDA